MKPYRVYTQEYATGFKVVIVPEDNTKKCLYLNDSYKYQGLIYAQSVAKARNMVMGQALVLVR